MLKGKKVLLGVTASIAAYKSAELVRLFKKSGAAVRVIQTKDSLQFVAPLTLATLSENQVLTEMVDLELVKWNNHVELGSWADIMVIAPLTAKTLSKMAHIFLLNVLFISLLQWIWICTVILRQKIISVN